MATKSTLELIYEQMRGVLVDQRQTASALETKSFALFAVTTAIVGVVLPIITQGTLDKTGLLMGLLAIPLLLYLCACVLFWYVNKLVIFQKLGNPETIEDYLDDDSVEFMIEAINQVKDAYVENESNLNTKREGVRLLLLVAVVAALVTIFWAVIASAVIG